MNKLDFESPQMPREVEEQILQNVFRKCGRSPNSIPIDSLISYSEYRRERYILLRVGIIVLLILFFLLPLLFISSKIDVHKRTDTAANRSAYNITVDGWIPIQKIAASMDGRTVPIYEAAGREFLLVPDTNGLIDVDVTLKNGQRTSEKIIADGIDLDAPEIGMIEYDDNNMYIKLLDDSKIDFNTLSLTADDGSIREVDRYDDIENTIVLRYPKECLLLKVSDIWGNELKLQLNTQI